MKVRCGHCKSDFRDATRAAAHVQRHPKKVPSASPGRSIWQVRWDHKTGLIAEVVGGPKWGYELSVGTGQKPG